MWDKFSNIMANEMHFEMDQHINVIDPDICTCNITHVKLNTIS